VQYLFRHYPRQEPDAAIPHVRIREGAARKGCPYLDIRVQLQTIDGRLIPVVIITYRFDDPSQIIDPPPSAVIVDHTPVYVDITATWSNREHTRTWW